MDKETQEFLEIKFNGIDQKFVGVDQKFDELKLHFGVIAEGLISEIQMVAEGHSIIREEIGKFRENVQEEFKEVRSLIKFSYAELDQ